MCIDAQILRHKSQSAIASWLTLLQNIFDDAKFKRSNYFDQRLRSSLEKSAHKYTAFLFNFAIFWSDFHYYDKKGPKMDQKRALKDQRGAKKDWKGPKRDKKGPKRTKKAKNEPKMDQKWSSLRWENTIVH